MLVGTLLMGNLFLRSGWLQATLFLWSLPLLVLKNAIRIATLSWLGAYVSMDFLTGSLHHRGGAIFFCIGVLLLIPVLLALQRFDRRPMVNGLQS
jgi:exosortase/archaeosortase family protein